MEIVSENYKKGDPFPNRSNPDVLRIYSFQTCPYAERALLVLTAKNIEHEIINVNLRDKPEWLLERNPSGKVPTIEFGSDNKILYESLVIVDYLDEVYSNGRQLRANDAFQRATDRIFVESISPYISVYGKAIHSKEDVNELWKTIKESLKKAEQILKKQRTAKFLSGNVSPGLTDYIIWPFIERLPIAIDILSDIKSDEYLRNELPTINDYIQQMLSDSTVKKVSLDYEVLLNFGKEMRQKLLD